MRAGAGGAIRDLKDIAMLDVCEVCGYTYDEYMSNPSWFNEKMKIKIAIDKSKPNIIE